MKYWKSVLIGMTASTCLWGVEENLLKNPEMTAKEPGNIPHWFCTSGTVKSSDGIIELIPGKEQGLCLQRFDPAPEQEYWLTYEMRSENPGVYAKIYAEEQRQAEKKTVFLTFSHNRKALSREWVSVTIPVSLQPGWKSFYVAILTKGKTAQFRNLKFTLAPVKSIDGNLLKNPALAYGEPRMVKDWFMNNSQAVCKDGITEISAVDPAKNGFVIQNIEIKPDTDYVLEYECSISGEGKGRFYAEYQTTGANGKNVFKSFSTAISAIPAQWKKISIPVKIPAGVKKFYIAGLVQGKAVFKVRNLVFRAAK